jgi:hypothetical protein
MRRVSSCFVVVAASLVLATGCKKATVDGAYSGRFDGMIMTPSATGGMMMQPGASVPFDLVLTGDATSTTAAVDATFNLNPDYSDMGRPRGGGETHMKCTLKATRVGDPGDTKGDAEFTIAAQECPVGPGPAQKVEGKLTAKRGQDTYDSVSIELKSTGRWGGEGEPRISFNLTFDGTRKKSP